MKTYIFYNSAQRVGVRVSAETESLALLEIECKYGNIAYKNWESLGAIEEMVQVHNN